MLLSDDPFGVDHDRPDLDALVPFDHTRCAAGWSTVASAIDPFGFDPEIVDFVTPAFDAVLRVNVEGGEHVPASGPAAIVANRGFGIFEPSVLGIAVRRDGADAGCGSSVRRKSAASADSFAASVRSARARPTCVRACAPEISSRSRSHRPGCAGARGSRRGRCCRQ